MSKLRKKKLEIHDQIVELEDFLRIRKRESATSEAVIANLMQQIDKLKVQFREA